MSTRMFLKHVCIQCVQHINIHTHNHMYVYRYRYIPWWGGGSCWGFCQPEWFNQRVESLPKNGWARAVFCHQESLEFIEANIRIPMPSLKRLENHQTTDPRLWGFQASMKGKPESNIENWKMMQQNFGFIFFYLRESNMAMENALWYT